MSKMSAGEHSPSPAALCLCHGIKGFLADQQFTRPTTIVLIRISEQVHTDSWKNTLEVNRGVKLYCNLALFLGSYEHFYMNQFGPAVQTQMFNVTKPLTKM